MPAPVAAGRSQKVIMLEALCHAHRAGAVHVSVAL